VIGVHVKRGVASAVIACLALASFVALAPSIASAAPAATPAICFPGTATGDYPPAAPGIEPRLAVSLSDGLLLPARSTGNRLVVTGAVPGLQYCGRLFSSPVDLGITTASDSGVLDFNNISLPADFQLGVVHQLDVFRQASLVGTFDFCVNQQGHLVNATACPGGTSSVKPAGSGNLPRTGLARLADFLKAAGVAFAGGVLFLYLRRRRTASVARA
jgi:LPXTG-motif cell wall-anchored protein